MEGGRATRSTTKQSTAKSANKPAKAKKKSVKPTGQDATEKGTNPAEAQLQDPMVEDVPPLTRKSRKEVIDDTVGSNRRSTRGHKKEGFGSWSIRPAHTPISLFRINQSKPRGKNSSDKILMVECDISKLNLSDGLEEADLEKCPVRHHVWSSRFFYQYIRKMEDIANTKRPTASHVMFQEWGTVIRSGMNQYGYAAKVNIEGVWYYWAYFGMDLHGFEGAYYKLDSWAKDENTKRQQWTCTTPCKLQNNVYDVGQYNAAYADEDYYHELQYPIFEDNDDEIQYYQNENLSEVDMSDNGETESEYERKRVERFHPREMVRDDFRNNDRGLDPDAPEAVAWAKDPRSRQI